MSDDLEGAILRQLYHLNELMDPKRKDEIVWIPESKEHVECLRELGLLATTNPCGPLAWDWEMGKYLRGRRVAIIPFDDDHGKHRSAMIAGSLIYWNALKIAVIHLSAFKECDLKEWLERYPTVEEKRAALIHELGSAPRWERTK